MMRFTWVALCAVGFSGCVSSSSEDAGLPFDAGMVPIDAGAKPDAGLDAGMTADAGQPDAGPTDAGTVPTYPPPLPCTKHVGTGSGAVDIQQAALGLVDDDVVCIAAGSYSTLNVANISASSGHRITIENDGLVSFNGPSGGSALTNVTLSGAGNGASATANGLAFKNISYRALQFNGSHHGLTLQYLEFENIGDYTIYFPGDGQLYDGTDATALSGLKVLHNRGKNFGPSFLTLGGHGNNADLVSIARNVEIAFNELSDAPKCGYVFWLGNGFGADVHHNRVSGIALQLAQHNGIVFLEGDGKIHHNYFRNYLGEGLRLWPYSYGQVGTLDVFDNVFLESMKYSPVEIQAFDADVNRSALTHFTNVRIFNNTCGNINLQTMLPDNYVMWVAGIVDTYGFGGGTVEVTNNLAFNIQMQKQNNPFLNVEGSGAAILSHNLYYDSGALAGLVDEVGVRLAAGSPAVGAGVAVPGLGDDFYGRPHGTPPDVGAVAH